MGRSKELAMENEDEKRDRRLAELLGISYEELSDLFYEINTEESEDGNIYQIIIEFDTKRSSKKVLSKIKNLESGCRVYLPPYYFNNENHDDYLH